MPDVLAEAPNDLIPGAPIKLTEGEMERLRDYFEQEFEDASLIHQQLEAEVKESLCLYMAEPAQREKNFPWKGASNLVLPLVAITSDSIIARIVNTVFGVDPFWSIRPLTKDFIDSTRPIQDYLDWSRKTEFDLYRAVKRWVTETVICGWSFLKGGWAIENHPFMLPTEQGFKPQVITRNRSMLTHVHSVDLIGQAGMGDMLGGDWVAHRIRLTDTELVNRVLQKMYTNFTPEDLEKKEDISMLADIFRVVDADYDQPKTRLNTIYEIWANMPIPGGKKKTFDRPVNMVLTYHRESKKFIRTVHNPFIYGQRPFIKGNFVEIPGRGRGFGIGMQLRHLQHEITTTHNQQVDNATIANTRFFVGKRGVFRSNTRIWPGRFLTSPDPSKDIASFQLGDIYQSSRALEVSIMAFAERRSGVSDYALGRESNQLGSRATATGTLAIIQEGNRRFDLNVRDMRAGLSDAGKLLLQLNQQFRARGSTYLVLGEDGRFAEMTLDLPLVYIADKLGVELTASTATINKQVEQQGLIALMGILIQNMQLGQQAAALVVNPQVPAEMREYTAKAWGGITDLVRKVAQTFDQQDIDALVPMAIAEGLENVGNGQPQQGSIGGPPGGASSDNLLGAIRGNGAGAPEGGLQ